MPDLGGVCSKLPTNKDPKMSPKLGSDLSEGESPEEVMATSEKEASYCDPAAQVRHVKSCSWGEKK